MWKREEKESKSESERDLKMLLCGFEGGKRGPSAKECRQPVAAGKCKETDSPREPAEGMQPCRHLVV